MAPEASQDGDDLTARARIRDAALVRFAQDGIDGASVRAIAAAADVSPALVIHHFGSKDGLRTACDAYAIGAIRDGKRAAVAAGPSLDLFTALRQPADRVVIFQYLGRALLDRSPAVAELIDELAADAQDNLALGIDAGMIRQMGDLRASAVTLTLWSLGVLMLQPHMARLFGVDDDPDAVLLTYSRAAIELLGQGVLTTEAATRFAAQLDDAMAHTRNTDDHSATRTKDDS